MTAPSPVPHRSALVSVVTWPRIIGCGMTLLVSALQNTRFMAVFSPETLAQTISEDRLRAALPPRVNT